MGRSRVASTYLKWLPVTLVLAMALWLVLRPALDTAVTGFAEVFVRAFEYPRVTRLEPVDHRAQVYRSDFRADSRIPTIPLTEIHFNTIVLLALFLALPKRFSRKSLERLLVAWSLLYLTQSLNLFFHVKCLYALRLGEWSQQSYSEFSRNFFGFWQYFTDLPGRFGFPFVLWLALFSEQVLPMLSAGRGPEPSPDRKSSRKR